MNARSRVLLAIGILMLAKAVFALVRPESFRAFAHGWLRTVRHVNTLVGITCMLIGLALFFLVLFPQPLVNWMLGILGILTIYGGTLYLRPSEFERVAEALVLRRRPLVIRMLGALTLALAAWIIWAALAA